MTYRLARSLNGYKINRSDRYGDVLSLIEYANTELQKEAAAE
jgi:hypothetical protein